MNNMNAPTCRLMKEFKWIRHILCSIIYVVNWKDGQRCKIIYN